VWVVGKYLKGVNENTFELLSFFVISNTFLDMNIVGFWLELSFSKR